LTILDVGHGNAAVLSDLHGIVVFDAGRGQHLRRFLLDRGSRKLNALLLSHADTDHCSGAISLLLDPEFEVERVFLNPDPTKRGKRSHRQLRLAAERARRERGTVTETQLTTSLTGRLDCGDVHTEVLFPPPELSMSGVGGEDLEGRALSPNSLSAAIRLLYRGLPIVLLGSDIHFLCLEDWRKRSVDATAKVLVFPHHGGLPGDRSADDAAIFAYEVGQQVQPEVIVFSIHRAKYGLPRQDVLDALDSSIDGIRFLCTQLPDEIGELVLSSQPGPWVLHRCEGEGGTAACLDGNVDVVFGDEGYSVQFAGR